MGEPPPTFCKRKKVPHNKKKKITSYQIKRKTRGLNGKKWEEMVLNSWKKKGERENFLFFLQKSMTCEMIIMMVVPVLGLRSLSLSLFCAGISRPELFGTDDKIFSYYDMTRLSAFKGQEKSLLDKTFIMYTAHSYVVFSLFIIAVAM